MNLLNKKTLIIGSSICALNIARELLSEDKEIIMASKEKENSASIDAFKALGIEPDRILSGTEIIFCGGALGNFKILMAKNGESFSKKVFDIIIAEQYDRKPNFSLYGLKPSENILPLSGLTVSDSYIKSTVESLPAGGKIAFLTGIGYESNPVITEEIMLASLKLQTEFNRQTYILTNNLKVAGNDLEKLYRETKKSGAIYFKFTNSIPEVKQNIDGQITIEFTDEITRHNFRISPALTIIDETISPSEYTKKLAAIFKLHTGADGFLQTGNVHRKVVYTNRKGILAAGPSRTVLNDTGNKIDSANAAALIVGSESDIDNNQTATAEININSCIRCLTCYRCCPYRAIDLDTRPVIMPDSCEGCGICFAECPRGAISLKFPDNRNIPDQIKQYSGIQYDKSSSPLIIAFCCSRSASRAKELALSMGHNLPQNLKVVEVPCSGLISIEFILSAFLNNAEGVLALTCHEGNCHSEEGNVFAANRVEQLKAMFENMNLKKERLEIKTLASNMGYEFAQIAKNFENTIKTLRQSS